MEYWHKVLQTKYNIVDKFNHNYVVDSAPKNFLTTLEIGCGDGEHLKYEKLTEIQKKNYFALDVRENMLKKLKEKYPEVNSSIGDCQQKLKHEDDFFDRIIAIHVLEHLPNLPETVMEMYRLCKKKREFFR